MIELPYPYRALWPNGRAGWPQKARETRKHREWARLATLADQTRPEAPTRLVATFYGKPTSPLPDRDNAISACKAFFDGIADACGVNDRTFGTPTILFGERTAHGAVVIELVDDARQSFGDIAARVVKRSAAGVE